MPQPIRILKDVMLAAGQPLEKLVELSVGERDMGRAERRYHLDVCRLDDSAADTEEMTLPDGHVIPPTGKAFDLEFAQTSKWDGDQLIVISAFWDAALQAKQLGLPQ